MCEKEEANISDKGKWSEKFLVLGCSSEPPARGDLKVGDIHPSILKRDGTPRPMFILSILSSLSSVKAVQSHPEHIIGILLVSECFLKEN